MGRDRDPYERTLELLRRRLRSGVLGLGRPLHIQALATELRVSTTPVREALARLSGEGLVERTPTGYAAPRHDVASVAGLYRLDEIYALAALPRELAVTPFEAALEPAADYAARTERALTRLCRPPGGAYWPARRNLWDRLAPFRLAEALVLPGAVVELERLEASTVTEARAGAMRAYYRRRMRAVAALLDHVGKYPSNIP